MGPGAHASIVVGLERMAGDTRRIVVLGAGVAGSAFAALAAYRGFRVSVYEARNRYLKPCGEAIHVSLRPRFVAPRIRARIRKYAFYVDGELFAELVFDEPRWLIINKSSLVDEMRSVAESYGARIYYGVKGPRVLEGVMVDARGGFLEDGRRRVLVNRAIVEGVNVDPERVELWFDSRRVGFYWVFPYSSRGDTANVGAGFLGEMHPHRFVASFVSRHPSLGGRIVDSKTSVITMEGGSLYSDGAFRIGEAAGLVNPATGEGIRPAILSAEALADALVEGGGKRVVLRRYARRVSWLRRSISLQRRILGMFEKMGAEERARTIRSTPRSLLKEIYVEGRLGYRSLVVAGLRRPGLAARMARALLG